ncbi:MAG: hypothetical protein HRU19_06410 [Pseudobacteriovorax sp.]|nr:hypothetical protein [Pseudobacteriovorax sp.]
MKVLSQLLTPLFAVSVFASGCAFIIDDSPDEYDETVYYWPSSTVYDFDRCDGDSQFSYCGDKADSSGQSYSWKPNCQSEDCQAVGLFVHYNLNQDLGRSASLWIEAYDNPYFYGSPLSSFRISGFDASKPTSTDREEIYLDPGEYYLRAYLKETDDLPLPAGLKDLEPVDAAIGVYGALSAPERVVVRPRGNNSPIHITIDQLLMDPDQKPKTDARFRFNISTEEDFYVPSDRNIIVQLLSEADIETTAEYSFKTSTNGMLIEGQARATELVTHDLAIASYYIFAFLDENGNGFYDSGELAHFVSRFDEPMPLTAKAKALINVELPLDLFPMIP